MTLVTTASRSPECFIIAESGESKVGSSYGQTIATLPPSSKTVAAEGHEPSSAAQGMELNTGAGAKPLISGGAEAPVAGMRP